MCCARPLSMCVYIGKLRASGGSTIYTGAAQSAMLRNTDGTVDPGKVYTIDTDGPEFHEDDTGQIDFEL